MKDLNRSRASVLNHTSIMGLVYQKRSTWTADEEKVLRERFPVEGASKSLQEEVAELLEAYTAKERSVLDCAEEMADVMEVLYAMGKTCAVSKREVEQVRSQKAAEKGTFSKKIFLVSTEK